MSAWMRLSAGLVAATMAAATVAFGVGDEALGQHGPPPPPPVRELAVAEPVVPDDGLHRVVVTVAGGVEQLVPALEPDRAVESDRASETVESDSEQIQVYEGAGDDWMDRVPPSATLATGASGELGYVDRQGRFHPLTGSTSGPDNDSEAGPEMPDDPRAVPADALASVPGVESVQPISDTSYAVEASHLDGLDRLGLPITEQTFYALAADPYEPYQWTLDNTGDNLNNTSIPNISQVSDADIDGVEAWAGATGRGIVVAIVDSGVDLSHPELIHAAWTNPGEDCDGGAGNGVDDDGNGYVDDCTGWDFGDNDRVSFDGANNPHGTHVAGIIAARSGNGQGIAGIAPDAAIMDLKVSDSVGAIPSSAIARAIRYAADNGADVVNLSLGSRPGDPPSPAMADAVAYAGAKGVLIVAAAGNNGVSLDQAPVYPASLNADHMLVVGATDPADQRTSFSNHGSALDIFAPGLYILSTTPGGNLEFQSGTSQASPTVAAAAALAMEAMGSTDPTQVIDRLTASADSLDQLVGLAASPVRLNAARAVGVAAGGSGAAGSVTLRGLAADDTGRVAASISIAVEDKALDRPYNWEASLYSLVDGGAYAITGHPVTAGAGDQIVEQTTDGGGTVGLAPAEALGATWTAVLPAGTYGLLIEAVPEGDPASRLGDGFLATFAVGSADSAIENGGTGGETGTSTTGGAPDSETGDTENPSAGSSGSTGDGSDVDDGSSGGWPPPETGTGDGGSTPGGTSGDDSHGSYQPPAGWGDGATSGDSPGSGTSDSGSGSDTPPGGTNSGTDSGSGSWDSSVTGDSGSGSDTSSGGATSGSDSDSGPGDGVRGSDDGDQPYPGADNGQSGSWAVSSILPQTGYVDTENFVQLVGSFPEQPTVWFGDSPAATVFFAPDLIVVATQRHATGGLVDVSLRRQTEQVLLLPDAFAFLPTDGGSPTGDGSTTGETGSGGGEVRDGGDVATNDESSGSPTDGPTDSDGSTIDGPTGSDGSIGDDGSGGGGSTVDDGASPSNSESGPQPRPVADGEPVELTGGLTGIPVTGLPISGSTPLCGFGPCRASRV